MAKNWFMYDPENGFETFETEGAALSAASMAINAYLDEEWGDGVDEIVVGRITHESKQANVQEKKDLDPEDPRRNLSCDYLCDYEMQPVK